ncbi:hypothetical protein SMD22_00140 (plasmid) [Brevibacillus halotolerans]|nr:hypothetical protein SMD22_00140 [Brevibacillus halotolerans]
MEDKMTDEEIENFIDLLQKWQKDDLNWGECCKLRDFSYRFSDTIALYFQNW